MFIRYFFIFYGAIINAVVPDLEVEMSTYEMCAQLISQEMEEVLARLNQTGAMPQRLRHSVAFDLAVVSVLGCLDQRQAAELLILAGELNLRGGNQRGMLIAALKYCYQTYSHSTT